MEVVKIDKLELFETLDKFAKSYFKLQSDTAALQVKQFEDIRLSIVKLEDKMDAGFDKITTRQDIANGRTYKNEKAIEENKKESDEKIRPIQDYILTQKANIRLGAIIWGSVSGGILVVLGWIATWLIEKKL